MTRPSSPPMKVMLVEDNDALREGLARQLQRAGKITIVATAHDGYEALELLRTIPTDLVLMDVEMPHLDGVEATRIITEEHANIRVAMYTAFERSERLSAAMAAGAVGFLTKDMPIKDVIDALERIRVGEHVLSPQATNAAISTLKLMGDYHRSSTHWNELVDELSAGQRAVYDELITGATNKEIAKKIAYSEGTVRVYVTQILDHFGCQSRTEVALRAARAGIVNKTQ